jgi:hypothetical protein
VVAEKMKHLKKFEACHVAEYILKNADRFHNAVDVAQQIEDLADREGMVHYFVVKDSVGEEPMSDIEANCMLE